MRRLLPFALLFCALPAAAQFSYSPSYMELVVGESAEARVSQPIWGPFPPPPRFVLIAEPDGIVRITEQSWRVNVEALSAGTATVIAIINGLRHEVGIVKVHPCNGVRIDAQTSYAIAPGQTVRIAPSLAGAVPPVRFEWYRGRVRDTREPVSGGPVFYFLGETPGTHEFWTWVHDRCSMTMLQFRIDVSVPKKRVVRR